MANQEIVDYIKKYKDSYPEDSIKNQLINNGYKESEINETFMGISTTNKSNSPDSQVTNLDNVHYVGFWARVLALILDFIIIIVLLFLVCFLVYFIIYFILSFIFPIAEIIALSITYVVSAVLFIIVFPTYEIIMVGKKGATLGKMVIGAKVIKNNGEEMDIESSAFRYVGKIVGGSVSFMGYIMVSFTKKKRGFHDMLVGTYVIYKK